MGLCLFAEYLSAWRRLDSEPGWDPAVGAFLHYVEDHFGEESCLQAAQEAAGISRNAVIYKFRQELHATPARYLWRLRTERGAAMLCETGHTAAEIAYRCGFSNAFHFSRLIKQRFGRSPRDLRREAWAQAAPRAPAPAPTVVLPDSKL